MTSRAFSVRRVLPLLAIGVAAVLGFIFLPDYLSFETLRNNRDALSEFRDENIVLALAAYMTIYVAVVALSLPGGVWMTLAGGFLFGALAATLATVAAATLGATVLFLAAKSGLGDALHARMVDQAREGGWLKRIEAGVHKNEFSVLFLMRLVPAVPFFVANLAPAFLGVGLRNYVISTFFGIIPATAAFSWMGAGLGEVFDRGETPDLGMIFTWPILAPILALCLLAALPILLRRLRGREAL